VAQRVLLGLNERGKPMKGSRVLVLGLSYKKNSNDARETPAVDVVKALHKYGAMVLVHDAHVGAHPIDAEVDRVELTADVVASADAVVLGTDHDDTDYELVLANAVYVFDARNRLRGPNVEVL
jgi:UDP-N-acetyl-D-mannosaminuronate dehydrogenase